MREEIMEKMFEESLTNLTVFEIIKIINNFNLRGITPDMAFKGLRNSIEDILKHHNKELVKFLKTK